MTRIDLPLLLRLELRLPPDHRWWAKSLVWSCGRPGYEPRFDWRAEWDRQVRAEYARAWVGATILRADEIGILPITGVT